MIEDIQNILIDVSFYDYVYIVITVFSVIRSTSKGFILSILSVSKWLMAYIFALFLFPKVKPYISGILDNEYVLDVILGVSLFVIIIFVILLINKGIKKAVTYSGLGTLDKVFGFFFGFLKGYIILVCIFSAINIVYNYEKWSISPNEAFFFPWVEKGSNYLIKEFPNEKRYEDTKNKVQDL